MSMTPSLLGGFCKGYNRCNISKYYHPQGKESGFLKYAIFTWSTNIFADETEHRDVDSCLFYEHNYKANMNKLSFINVTLKMLLLNFY